LVGGAIFFGWRGPLRRSGVGLPRAGIRMRWFGRRLVSRRPPGLVSGDRLPLWDGARAEASLRQLLRRTGAKHNQPDACKPNAVAHFSASTMKRADQRSI
jgi:hypothetical protein